MNDRPPRWHKQTMPAILVVAAVLAAALSGCAAPVDAINGPTATEDPEPVDGFKVRATASEQGALRTTVLLARDAVVSVRVVREAPESPGAGPWFRCGSVSASVTLPDGGQGKLGALTWADSDQGGVVVARDGSARSIPRPGNVSEPRVVMDWDQTTRDVPLPKGALLDVLVAAVTSGVPSGDAFVEVAADDASFVVTEARAVAYDCGVGVERFAGTFVAAGFPGAVAATHGTFSADTDTWSDAHIVFVNTMGRAAPCRVYVTSDAAVAADSGVGASPCIARHAGTTGTLGFGFETTVSDAWLLFYEWWDGGRAMGEPSEG